MIVCSHRLAYAIEAQPIGALLGEAIGGGELVDPGYWHPLRAPLVHSAKAARKLAAQLRAGWEETLRGYEGARESWYRDEIEPVVELFEHAAARGETVVSALEAPSDPERAERVRLPFVVDLLDPGPER